jgi:hypothetical protein
MADQASLSQVAALAALLPPAERRQLAEGILSELAGGAPQPSRRRSWREIRGSAPYPLCDVDAQQWISEVRQDSDDHREQQWRSEE